VCETWFRMITISTPEGVVSKLISSLMNSFWI
jgi:hypothetical protein